MSARVGVGGVRWGGVWKGLDVGWGEVGWCGLSWTFWIKDPMNVYMIKI